MPIRTHLLFRLLAPTLAALALLTCLLAASAHANVIRLTGQSPSPSVPTRVTVSQDNGNMRSMNLRVFEVKQWLPPVGEVPGEYEHRVVLKNMSGEIAIEPGLQQACAFARGNGQRSLSAADVSTVECDFERVQELRVNGTVLPDLVCTISPANADLNIPYKARMSAGKDGVTGSTRNDEINGGAGNDALRGWSGRDRIFGYEPPIEDARQAVTSDADSLWGEAGDDSLWGGPGADELVGGAGMDFLCGADAGVYDPANPDPVDGCDDGASRDGPNRLFSSELVDTNLDTGAPAPGTPEQDIVECGGTGAAPTHDPAHLTQYSAGLDLMLGCPTRQAPVAAPNQLSLPYRSVAQKSIDEGTEPCPPIRE